MPFIKKYTFTTANGFDVTIETTGEYRGHWSKDVSVHYWDGTYSDRSNCKDFVEIDQADEIIEWLISEGMTWTDKRAFKFNVHYIESVLLVEDRTEEQLLNDAANWTEEQLLQTWNYFEMED